MQKFSFEILPADLLQAFLQQVPENLETAFHSLQEAELSTENFSFYTSVASVFSSKIEGEEIELDSYVKHKRFGVRFQPDYTGKVDDLYAAYRFAQANPLNEKNVGKAHSLLSHHLLAKHQQGKLRTQNMYVTTPDGHIEYVAASPFELAEEMTKLYKDTAMPLKKELTVKEVFFSPP